MLRPGSLLLLALVALAPSTASAEASPWLILPTRVEGAEASAVDAAADALATSLVARGIAAWSPREAAGLYEGRVSAPASTLTRSDIEDWVARSQAAVRHLAHADYDAARRDLLEAQALSRRAAEELNREAERARQVLDTCLYMVRALVETGDTARARAEARECRQLVPTVEPSVYRHTPEVRELLAEVDAAMAAEPPAALRVESAPAGCAVRLNGISFGHTPFRMDGLASGEYRLQVECVSGARGRVRRVRLTPGETVVQVDAALEGAVKTESGLALRYADAPSRARLRLPHARAVASALGASRVLLVEEEEGSIRFDLVDAAAGSVVASVWVPAGPPGASAPASASAAASALARTRTVDLRPHAASDPEPWSPPATSGAANAGDAERAGTARRRWGLSLVSVGGAAFAVGWGLMVRRHQLGSEYAGTPPQDPESTTAREAWEGARIPVLGLSVPGAAMATVGAALATPSRARLPRWGWALIAGGAGLAVAGGVLWALRPRCADPGIDPAACVNRDERADQAALLWMASAPLLAAPLASWARRAELEASASVGRRGMAATLRGRF